jgi:hypothetical protein
VDGGEEPPLPAPAAFDRDRDSIEVPKRGCAPWATMTDLRRTAAIAIALSLLGLTVAPAAAAGFPPKPDPSPDCELESAQDQAGHTLALLDHQDHEQYASDTIDEVVDYVYCEFFPI